MRYHINMWSTFKDTSITFCLNIYCILVGRFLLGFAGGLMICGCNLYISETVPGAQREIYGIAINSGIITGLLITSLFGLILPEGGTQESKSTQLWRVSVGFGLIPAMITQTLFQVVFKKESLKYIVHSLYANTIQGM